MKRFASATIVICLATVVFPHLCVSYSGPMNATVNRQESTLESPHTSRSNAVPTSELEAANNTPNSLLLGEECPDWLDDSIRFDTKCLGAVERYFLDKAVYIVTWPGMVPKKASFTFRTMFDLYENDKKLVTDVLADPDCRLLRGPMRLDLRDKCNAEALFRYTQFANLCHDAREMNWFEPDSRFRGKSRYQQNSGGIEDFENAHEEGNEHLGHYYSYRNDLRKRVLRDVWLESHDLCPSDFLSLQEGTNTRRMPMEPHRALTKIAARLGDEQTLFAFNASITMNFGDKAYRRSKARIHAWQGQMITTIGGKGIVLPINERNKAIVAAARGIVGMRKAGYEADVQKIVKVLCSNDYRTWRDESIDCATAYQLARVQLDPIDLQVLDTLDEIKETAVKLDLYQFH